MNASAAPRYRGQGCWKEWGIYVHNPVRDIKLPPGGRPRDRRLQPG